MIRIPNELNWIFISAYGIVMFAYDDDDDDLQYASCGMEHI